MSAPSDVPNTHLFWLNTRGPYLTSESHPDNNTWSENRDGFVRWDVPYGQEHYKGYYYVVSNRYDTKPTAADTFLPAAQLQVILSNLGDGMWVFHLITEDTMGVMTQDWSRHVFRIGPEPEYGAVNGQVLDAQGAPVPGATVRVNGGLFTTTTDGDGNFNIQNVPVGPWEATVEHDEVEKSQMTSVSAGAGTNLAFTM